MKQISFFPKVKKSFGPKDLMGQRKQARILSSRHAMHVVLTSDVIIELGYFYKYKKIIERELKRLALKFGIRIYSLAINSDHIHLILQIQNRKQYNRFIAALTGSIAKKILESSVFEACRQPNQNETLAPRVLSLSTQLTTEKKKFWRARPFTRILEWGKDFHQSQNYLYQNKMESLKVANYDERNANTILARVQLFTDQSWYSEELLTCEDLTAPVQLVLGG